MTYTREQLDQMNVVAPELAAAVRDRALPAMPTDMLEYRAARAQNLSKLRHLMPVGGPIPNEVVENEVFVTVRDGHQVRVIVYTAVEKLPTSPSVPLILLFHEGGWMMGDLTDEEFNARLLTRELGVTCLNVEYRLAPEHPFPTSIDDCWDVTLWAARNASPSSSLVPADPSLGFIVGGSSAGGNIAAIIAHLSRNTNLQPRVTGQWLSVPYLMGESQVPDQYRPSFISMTENSHDPILKHLDVATNAPLFDVVKPDLDSPLFSTLASGNYPNDNSKSPMANAFFQCSGLDPLRDHALIYSQILQAEYGTKVRVEVYHGYSHMFWSNFPELQASRKFASDMVEGFKWLLGRLDLDKKE